MRLLWIVCLTAACQTYSEPPGEFIRYGHLSLYAETVPVWDETCLQKASAFSHWAISLVLQRDRVLDVPEWVSGHRYALAAACETFSPDLLIIETPSSDSLFYPTDSLAREAWQNTLKIWLLEDLLPTISTYPSLMRVAWGKGFIGLALPERFWEEILRAARQDAPHIQWGFVSDKPAFIPLYSYWDFTGIFIEAHLSPEITFSQPLQKPVLYFLTDKDFPLRSLPRHVVASLVFYSKHHLPTVCQ